MNLESIAQAVVQFVRANREFAPLILGLLAFSESLAFVSLVIPAATILIAVGFVVAAADLVLAGLARRGLRRRIGSLDLVHDGGRYKKAAYGIWPLSRNPGLIAKGERFFFRFGPWAVFFGRFFGPTRAVLPLIAGIFQMPNLLFQSANMASAFVWAFIVLAPGAGLARYLF